MPPNLFLHMINDLVTKKCFIFILQSLLLFMILLSIKANWVCSKHTEIGCIFVIMSWYQDVAICISVGVCVCGGGGGGGGGGEWLMEQSWF